jgi:signal transduction histidine kinase
MVGGRSALVRSHVLIVIACLSLLAGGLVELATLHYSRPVWVAVVSCVGCTLAPSLGRRCPAISAMLAVGAVATYQVVTDDPNGGFVVAATVLACYYLGRDHPGTASARRLLAVVGVAFPAVLVASLSDHDSGVSALGTWFVLVVVPTGVGRVVQRRQRLVTRLGQAAEALQVDQLRAADSASALERARVARELHDVVAHYVSVMVIQAGAARTVSVTNPEAGRAALDAVEAAGRRALDELRRVLGVLRRGPDDRTDSAVNLTRIRELCESVSAAGVHVTLTATDVGDLAVQSSQAAYRIVQEALTNVARHAPGAHAAVVIRRCNDELDLVVTDDGGRTHPEPSSLPRGGHGLVGMAERAAWLGGSLRAGPRPEGGFRVTARFPVRLTIGPEHDVLADAPWPPAAGSDDMTHHRDWMVIRRWFDLGAAAVIAVALGINAGLRVDGNARVPSVLLGVILGVLVRWRRERPMAYLLATLAVTVVLTVISASVSADLLFGVFALVVPTYTAGAWLPRGRAGLVLAIWAADAAVHAARDQSPLGQFIGALVMAVVVFAVGRLTRSQRTLAEELDARNAMLAAQRDTRARVAALNERTRIARDLHVLIAETITSMVVQAETASELVHSDHARAYTAAAEVERSGREVLTQMRQVLGVLRADRSVPLQPPPSVDVLLPAAVATA